MRSEPIAAASLEQAENAKKAGLLNNMAGPAKEAAPMLSAESQKQSTESHGSKQEEDIEVVKTEGFRSQIFTQLLGLMTKSFDASKESDNTLPSSYVLQLVVDLALESCTEELKTARGKEMVVAFTKNLPNLVRICQSKESSFLQHRSKLVVSLRTLASLLQKRDIHSGPSLASTMEEEKDVTAHNQKDKTDPR